MASLRDNAKCARACEYCRLKKIKCDAKQPCGNCVLRSEECITIPLVRKNTRERHRLLQMRAERAEALLAAAGIADPNGAHNYSRSPRDGIGHPFMALPPREITETNARTQIVRAPTIDSSPERPSTGVMNQRRLSMTASHRTQASVGNTQDDSSGNAVFQSVTPFAARRESHHPIAPSTAYSVIDDRAQSQVPALTISPTDTSSTSEHHGPESYMSICSDSGVQWVSEKIGLPDFNSSASSLASVVSQSLKVRRLERHRKPEPDPEIAWEYTKAYFQHTLEADMGTVNRRTFETRLQAHFDGGDSSDQDPSWYALRNMIYAFGCRSTLCQTMSKDAWAEAQTESWTYFENALSVHTELVYFPSTATAAEALLVMALFVESAGAPKLEYMLISNALRLAQSKALHLQPPASTRMQPAEMVYRNWLFWAIYNFEKHITYRSGRPSAIDDEEITCELPISAPNGKPIHAQLFRCYVEHAQISSATMKSLSRTKTAKLSPVELINTVEKLDRRLHSWYQNIPQALRPNLPFRKSNLPEGIQLEHSLYLHFAYHGSLIAIHSFFGYPWNLIRFASDCNTNLSDRMESSTRMVAEASRNLIIATREINIDAEAPVWLIFYYPILGMINLFIHILRFPTLPTVPSDIQLIDMAAAYFGYVDFSTGSRVSFSFTRDIAHWARVVSEKARATSAPAMPAISPPASTTETFPNCAVNDFTAQLGNLDPIGLGDVEDWPSFLSSMSQVPLMAWNEFSWNDHSNGRYQ